MAEITAVRMAFYGSQISSNMYNAYPCRCFFCWYVLLLLGGPFIAQDFCQTCSWHPLQAPLSAVICWLIVKMNFLWLKTFVKQFPSSPCKCYLWCVLLWFGMGLNVLLSQAFRKTFHAQCIFFNAINYNSNKHRHSSSIIQRKCNKMALLTWYIWWTARP